MTVPSNASLSPHRAPAQREPGLSWVLAPPRPRQPQGGSKTKHHRQLSGAPQAGAARPAAADLTQSKPDPSHCKVSKYKPKVQFVKCSPPCCPKVEFSNGFLKLLQICSKIGRKIGSKSWRKTLSTSDQRGNRKKGKLWNRAKQTADMDPTTASVLLTISTPTRPSQGRGRQAGSKSKIQLDAKTIKVKDTQALHRRELCTLISNKSVLS